MSFEIIAANLAAFIGAAVQAATGAGFAMVSVPLLALIDLAWVPGPMLLGNIALSVILAGTGRDALVRSEGPPLAAGLVLGSFAGAGVLALFTGRGLGVLIGAIIVAGVLASLVAPPLALTRRRLLAGSFLGGATGVIAGMHGPPLILLYQREHPAKVRATMAAVFIFGSILALVSLWLAGRFGPAQLWLGVELAPGVALGYLAGKAIGGRLSRSAVRYAMLGLAGAAGLALLLKSL